MIPIGKIERGQVYQDQLYNIPASPNLFYTVIEKCKNDVLLTPFSTQGQIQYPDVWKNNRDRLFCPGNLIKLQLYERRDLI